MRKHQAAISHERRAATLDRFIVTMNEDQIDEMEMLVETIVDFLDRIAKLDSSEEHLVHVAAMLAYMEFTKRRTG